MGREVLCHLYTRQYIFLACVLCELNTIFNQVTSVTHNIPSFLRDPAVALIGARCYTILVHDFNVTHVECLKYALSKGLGLGIVIGGGIVKIPQVCLSFLRFPS